MACRLITETHTHKPCTVVTPLEHVPRVNKTHCSRGSMSHPSPQFYKTCTSRLTEKHMVGFNTGLARKAPDGAFASHSHYHDINLSLIHIPTMSSVNSSAWVCLFYYYCYTSKWWCQWDVKSYIQQGTLHHNEIYHLCCNIMQDLMLRKKLQFQELITNQI